MRTSLWCGQSVLAVQHDGCITATTASRSAPIEGEEFERARARTREWEAWRSALVAALPRKREVGVISTMVWSRILGDVGVDVGVGVITGRRCRGFRPKRGRCGLGVPPREATAERVRSVPRSCACRGSPAPGCGPSDAPCRSTNSSEYSHHPNRESGRQGDADIHHAR